ncbi:MAG: HAMP domain-containing protein [Deltaproteobacteria bacterium]|nr:HAMP domain-containing protein [Deltaproteobacteria bacterium]
MIWRLDVKFVLILIITAVMPMIVSLFFVRTAVKMSLAAGLNRDIANSLDNSLTSYRNFIEAQKTSQNLFLNTVLLSEKYINACKNNNSKEIENALLWLQHNGGADYKSSKYLNIKSLTVETSEGKKISSIKKMVKKDEYRDFSKTIKSNVGACKNLTANFLIDTTIVEDFKKAANYTETYKTLYKSQESYLLNRIMLIYVILLGVIVLISINQGVLHTRRLTKRIHSLSKATKLVSEGDLSIRVDPERQDEAGQLVNSFNNMVMEIEQSKARIEYLQKISAWQEIARRLAHEIKNPLTPIHLASQQLKSKYDGDDPVFKKLLNQSTEIIDEEVETLKRLVAAFSNFAKLPEIRPEQVEVSKFLSDCKTSFDYIKDEYNVNLVFVVPKKSCTVLIDTMLLKRVIDNLIKNGAEAIKDSSVKNPSIHIFAETIPKTKNREQQAAIYIKDNGPGIPVEAENYIFDPYYTTKDEGTGLGLAICKKIVLEHRGKIELSANSEDGATFKITLPCQKA